MTRSLPDGRLTSVSLINGLKHWLDRAKEAGAIADEMKDPDASAAETGVCGVSALIRIVSDRAISGEQREKISFHQINKKWMRPTP
jgi:hypothetical protein